MATSGSTDFTLTKAELIKYSMQLIGVVGPGNTVSTEDFAIASTSLNLMLKHWQTRKRELWLRQNITIFLEKNKQEYTISSSGDHATTSYTSTTTSAAASSGASTVVVTSATGLAINDNIGIYLSDGTRQWTTISNIVSTTITLADTLTANVASGATVYAYTTKASAPKEVLGAVFKGANSNTFERRLTRISDFEHFHAPQKDSTGEAVRFQAERQRNAVVVKPWPVADTSEDFIVVRVTRTIEDVDASTDDFDLPQEWLEPVAYNLALRLLPIFQRTSDSLTAHISAMAADSLQNAHTSDNEDVGIWIEPDFGDNY